MQSPVANNEFAIAYEKRLELQLKHSLTVVEQAVSLAQQFCTPLLPEAYELWYEFIEGGNSELNKRLHKLMNEQSSLDVQQFHDIYDEFISFQFARDRIDTELDAVILASAENLGKLSYCTSTHKSTLDKINSEIEFAKGDPFFRDCVRMLIQANQEMRDAIEWTSEQLDLSKNLIGELRSEITNMQEAAYRDPLTQLGNRRFFEKELLRLMKDANENKQPLCLAMIDIDYFKVINDNHGHLVGDSILRYFALFIQQRLPKGAVICRYGGEEFTVIIPGTRLEASVDLIDSIRSKIESSSLLTANTRTPIGRVTASFGVTCLQAGDSRNSIVERADAMLYLAKDQGRNRVVSDSCLAA